MSFELPDQKKKLVAERGCRSNMILWNISALQTLTPSFPRSSVGSGFPTYDSPTAIVVVIAQILITTMQTTNATSGGFMEFAL